MSKIHEAFVENYLATCSEHERAAVGGLMYVSKGLGTVDAAPAKIKDTGEEVIALVIRMGGRSVPIGHIAKDRDMYEPFIPKELKDVA